MSDRKLRPASIRRAANRVATNARKRLFEAESLVQAGKTPYELIYQGEIAQLRYYPPLSETSITVGDSEVKVETSSHRIPLVLTSL
ncbi:MAG: hypothetical protein COA99_15310 [Moraxellaceae bacterium]|nr:MAG: hypothetical protein COA99_15310 [Moraxellaceae bacterium]